MPKTLEKSVVITYKNNAQLIGFQAVDGKQPTVDTVGDYIVALMLHKVPINRLSLALSPIQGYRCFDCT